VAITELERGGGAPAILPGAKHARGRPRSELCHASILDSVLSLLEREGYGALTIEGVARHAKVGKQSIYRRWRSKAELVLEAYASHVETKVPIPDRGSLRVDLLTFLGTALRRLNRTSGPIMRGLMADGVHDADFNRVLRDVFILKRRQSVGQILERGIGRGELRPDTDLDLMLDLIFGPIWYRLLSQHGKLDAAFAGGLCDALLRGFGVAASGRAAKIAPLRAGAKSRKLV
jgi:AcrR family transcriptional regulator